MLWLYQRVFFGPLTHVRRTRVLKDLSGRELLYLMPLVILCFVIGIVPGPFFDVIKKPVDYLVQKVDPSLVPSSPPAMSAVPSASRTGREESRAPLPSLRPQEYFYLAPEMLLATAGLILLLFGSVGRGLGNREAAGVSLFGLALTGGLLVSVASPDACPAVCSSCKARSSSTASSFFWKAVDPGGDGDPHRPPFSSMRFLEEGGYRAAEYYALILLASAGMMFMASGYTLLTIWISLETMALLELHPRRLLQAPHIRSERSGAQIFHPGRAVLRHHALWHLAPLWSGGPDAARRSVAEASGDAGGPGQHAGAAGLDPARLLASSSRNTAVPFHVWTPDVSHRRADAGDGLPRGGLERRLRSPSCCAASSAEEQATSFKLGQLRRWWRWWPRRR